jgi:hypothetical protein
VYFVWMPYDQDPGHRPGTPKVLDPCADPDTLRAAVHALTTEELASAWGSSTHRLAAETDGARRLAVAGLRGMILDELERRSPRRYRRWLQKGGPSARD